MISPVSTDMQTIASFLVLQPLTPLDVSSLHRVGTFPSRKFPEVEMLSQRGYTFDIWTWIEKLPFRKVGPVCNPPHHAVGAQDGAENVPRPEAQLPLLGASWHCGFAPIFTPNLGLFPPFPMVEVGGGCPQSSQWDPWGSPCLGQHQSWGPTPSRWQQGAGASHSAWGCCLS